MRYEKTVKTTLHERLMGRIVRYYIMPMTYVSPDYPIPGNYTTQWTYQDQVNPQGYFYGGMNNYQNYSINDPNSRINQTSFNFNQSPYQQQTQQNPYGYAAPVQNQPAVTPVQPFSAYGGSGQQPVMPTLNPPTLTPPTVNPPTLNITQPQQQVQMPTFAQPVAFQNTNPMFNDQIPTFDKRTECWCNQYVQPQQLPVPNIDWNKPVEQPMVNPMYSFQPQIFDKPHTFQDNWVDTFKRNLAVSL